MMTPEPVKNFCASSTPIKVSEKAKKNAGKILSLLEKEYPDAHLILNFTNPLELLVATILAAQCPDVRVNQVTEALFKKYKTPQDYTKANLPAFEKEISKISFYRGKAKNIINACRMIVERFDGKLPKTTEELTQLPGVGRKTANIVLSNAMGIHALGVDTHLWRVSNRIGLSEHNDPDKIESDLVQLFPKDKWLKLMHVFQAHGRTVCHAKKPLCRECVVNEYCDYYASISGKH